MNYSKILSSLLYVIFGVRCRRYLVLGSLVVGLIACGGTTPTKDAPVVKVVAQKQLDSLSDSQVLKYQKAVGALRQKKYAQAEKLLSGMRKKASGVLEVELNLGLAFYYQNKFSEAEYAAAQSLGINAESKVAHNLAGLVAIELGKFFEAEKHFVNALKLDKSYSHANYNLALLYDVYLHNIPAAVEYYQRYMTKAPNDENTAAWIDHLKSSVK